MVRSSDYKVSVFKRVESPPKGYIAEEMAELGLDELIGYDAEGQVENFNYEKMILHVVEVLKMQQQQIDVLQKEIQRLNSNVGPSAQN